MSLFACLAVFAAVSASANAATTGPTGAKATNDPTESKPVHRQGPVVLKVADRSVNFGGRFRLRGKTGNAVSGHVRIQASFGGKWHTLRKVRTDRTGRFNTKVRARASTSLRVRTNDGRNSKVRRVAVIGHVKLARPDRYVRLGDSLVIRGTVVPRGARTVKVRVRGEGVVTTRTRSNGRFRVRWKPRNNGDFSYRVRALPSHRSTGDSSLNRRFSALRPGHASYYGPGLYGNGVACGGTLTPTTRGVAHKYLPCGTRVTLQYDNRTVVARVIDRGPYIAGRDWDLTEQTRNDLGFGGVGVVWTNK
jgi:hypothetical protein